MDFYLLGVAHGWTWDDWCNTPGIVKTLMWTYFQMQNEAEADAAKG
jgi:hypothetical protein